MPSTLSTTAGVTRVVCLTLSRSPATRGRSWNQHTVASKLSVTVGGSSSEEMRSPREMSISSVRFIETERPTSARGIGPSAVSMERTVVY